MDAYIGEIAALLAAFSFSLTSVFYALAGRRINVIVSLAASLPISWLLMMGLHWLAEGEFFPSSASLERWLALAASGILAYVISSWFILHAYQFIGPRLTMLIASFAPILGAALAFVFLGQALPPNSALGVALVMFGIVWVVAERRPTPGDSAKADLGDAELRRGVVFAVLGTLAQGLAFVFSSQGVAGGFPPFSGTLMRVTAGMAALWLFIAGRSEIRQTLMAFGGEPKTMLQIGAAAVLGPIVAGSFLLLAFQHIPVGVATTLSHTTAIMLIPIGRLVFKERISLRAVIGTVVTIMGIAVLFS